MQKNSRNTCIYHFRSTGSVGQRFMQAEREPPGHPDGAGDGPGDGDGPGEGPGAEPSVEPSSPNLILENVTEELGAFFSTSSGFPESEEHVPRAAPGSELPTG